MIGYPWDSDIRERGQWLYDRLTEMPPEDVTLEDLMASYDGFAADPMEGPWPVDREEVERVLAAYMEATR